MKKEKNSLISLMLSLGMVVAIVPVAASVISERTHALFSMRDSANDVVLNIDAHSGVDAPAEFGEVTYNYNQHASFTFSSIKSTNDGVGVLQAHSTIVKNQASKGLRGVNATFSGGVLFAYSRFEEAEETEFKYTLTSGAETFVTGNYVRFEVGDTDVTLTSLSILFNCNNADVKPDTPLGLLPEDHNTLRIEAEDATIVDPAGTIVCGVESGKNVNNPSGGEYVYGLNKATAKRTYLTFMFESNAEGFAVLSFGLGLNSNRVLEGMWDVEVNGQNYSIWNSGISCPDYSTVQYFDWTKIAGYVIDVKQGINAIKLTLNGTTGPLNFDYIELDSVLSLDPKNTYYSTRDANDASSLVSTTATTYTEHLILNKYQGHYGSTGGQTFTYEFSVEENAVAYLYLVVARNKNLKPAANLSTLTVNGSSDGVIFEDYTIPYTISGETSGWGNWCEVSFAIINLTAGDNTILFTVKDGQSTNYAGISFVATTDVLPLSGTITQADLIAQYGDVDQDAYAAAPTGTTFSGRGITTTKAASSQFNDGKYNSQSTAFSLKIAVNSDKAANVKLYFYTAWAKTRTWYPAEVIKPDPNDSNLRQLYVNGDNSSETVTDYNLVPTSLKSDEGWVYFKRYFASFNLKEGLNVIELNFNNYNWNFTNISFTGACKLILADLPVE